MGKRGGKRPGAGRKKGTLSEATIKALEGRELLVSMVKNELVPILSAQIALAKGIKVMTEQGEIFEKAPDVQAAKNLIEQALGKAKESKEVDIKGTLSLKALHEALEEAAQ